MLKKTLLAVGMVSALNASMTHTFYFTNNYELVKENKVTEKKKHTNEKLQISDKTKTDIKVLIKITEKVKENKTPIEKEHGWNPLKDFFKYQVEPTPSENTIVEKVLQMKNGEFYVLSLIMDGDKLANFNFLPVKNEEELTKQLQNKKNIIIKADARTSTFHILNKKHDINFNDNFIVRFKNRKLELNYKDEENALFN